MPAIVNRSNGIKRIVNGIFISTCLLFSATANSYAETTPTDTSGGVAKAAAGYGDSSMSSTGGTALPDLFTGTMSYSIPITVPPGRKGMNPGIALTYRSYNGNGWIGVGWELEVGSIQRSLKGGVDYAGNLYQLRKTGASLDLVNISGSDYQAKIEGEFTKITQMPATTASGNQPYWIATDRTGTRFTFGDTAASRQDDPNNSANIFKWCLSRVEDTNGNFMTLTYFKDLGQIYLDRIDYTGNGAIAPTNYVKFYREARNDAPEMHTTNFKVKTAYRLKTIEAVANSALANAFQAYKLTYQESVSSSQSLLASVQQFGGDVVVDRNTGNITNEATASKLPAMSFDKLYDAKGFTPSPPLNMAVNTAAAGFNLLGDFNGDGKMDTLAIVSSNSISVNYSAFVTYVTVDYSQPLSPNYPFVTHSTDGFAPQTYTLTTAAPGLNYVGDFNGDGKMDLFCVMAAAPGTYSTTGWMHYSTGSGFNSVYIDTGLNINSYDSGTCMVDPLVKTIILWV